MPGQLPRESRTFSQFLRYLNALRESGFQNVQPGPDIMPDSTPLPDGSTLVIFSGSDWNKYAGSKRPASYDNPGIIYYREFEPPRRRSPNKPPLDESPIALAGSAVEFGSAAVDEVGSLVGSAAKFLGL